MRSQHRWGPLLVCGLPGGALISSALTSPTWPSSQKLRLPLLFLDSNTSRISLTAVSQTLLYNLLQDLTENVKPTLIKTRT